MASTAAVRDTLTIDLDGLTPAQRTQLRRAVDDAVRAVVSPEDELVVLGWTSATLQTALERLEAQNAEVQAETIREALSRDGYVARARVYKIGRYSKDRTLRGFTRPVNRIVAALKEEGLVPAEAADLLEPDFHDGPVAAGFYSPADLVVLLD